MADGPRRGNEPRGSGAFKTISEVADVLDIKKHVLRFWEQKFPQLKPMKRGGGRRYYRPDDVRLLFGIRQLLYEDGFTVKGVQRIFKERGVDAVKALGAEAEAEAQAPKLKPLQRGKRTTKARTPDVLPGTLIGARDAADDHAAPPMMRDAIEHAIGELEACRKLLAAGLPAAKQPKTKRAEKPSGR